MALTDKLTAIAVAIREKGGTSEKLKLDEMPAAIAALEVGGGGSGGDGVPETITYTGKLDFAFANNNCNWLLENYGSRITTDNVSSAKSIFEGMTSLIEIPFKLNPSNNCHISFSRAFVNSSAKLPKDYFDTLKYKIGDADYMFSTYQVSNIPAFSQCKESGKFYEVSNLFNGTSAEEIGDLELSPTALGSLFMNAKYLRHCPNIKFNSNRFQTYAYGTNSQIFNGCKSLRTIPETVLKNIYGVATSASYSQFHNYFANCYCLDEIVGINPQTGVLTSNVFGSTFSKCYRVKRIVFDTINGTPYNVNWKNQTINLYDGVGWLTSIDTDIHGLNSGITADKKIVDGETYQALKNDPDCYTGHVEYSRFNHDSAVEFINSLPNTSAYLATNGGSNTVNFRNQAGELTDGGKIGNLTEEEIAIAVNKGWTITYKT